MSVFSRKSKGDNNYYQHDNRGSGNFNTRRVSFKQGSRQQGWDNKIRKHLEDNGDVDMTIRVKRNATRFNPVKSRGGKPVTSYYRRILSESPSSWYRVILRHGKKYERKDIMTVLQNFIHPMPFVPIAVKLEEDDLTFFVDNHKIASALLGANFRVQMRDGWKIQIKVESRMPFVELNPALKEKIKQGMSSVYDASTNHLNLSKFYNNEEFLKNDIFVPLNRQNILLAVFQIIAESVPGLRSLNLSDNKIFSTEHFSMLKKHASELKVLDLSKNKISDLSKLSCLQGLKLEALVLDSNPLCDKFQDQTTYVREVRKIFRSLLYLDGVELPPPVSFDIEETSTRLPPSQGNFLCNVDGRVFTRQFLEQYFAMYDNQASRDAISEAYAEGAQFSMTAYTSASTTPTLSKYISESRNLKKVTSYERRTKMLHVGKQEIVRFLNTLPKTRHDLQSFTVDLLIFTPELISLCVCGMFRETEMNACVKAFSRTFILIPAGSGFNIVNDMISITDTSKEQAASAFEAQPSTSNIQGASNMLNTTPVAPAEIISPMTSPQEMELNRKREMVTALALQTGMNLIWSEKCLVETNWDYNSAVYAFTEFHKLGKIPAEAFNK